MEFELDMIERKQKSKSATSALRRSGQVPVIVYVKGQDGQMASVSRTSFEEVLRKLEMGFLATSIFVLKGANGKKVRAIIKEIQYEPVSYVVRHIDFLELAPETKIQIKVPLQCIGEQDCVGIKAGGYLRRVHDFIPVRCLPKDIPSHFEVNVSDVDIRQTKSVKDIISMPKGLDLLLGENQVIATVMK